MIVTPEQIEKVLKEKVGAIEVIAEDQSSGCGAKFSVIVISDSFEGKTLLERHRLVNDALSEEIKHIHAITLKTWTSSQWEKKKTEQ